MATLHTILASIPVCARADAPRIEVLIEYSPRLRSDTLDLVSAVMVDTEGPEPTRKRVRQLAQRWLDGDGFYAARQRAEETYGFQDARGY